MIKLYPHQEQLMRELSAEYKRGHKSVIMQLPTGGGKSVCAGYLAQKLLEGGKKVLFMVHLRELVHQLSKTCSKFGLDHGFIASGAEFESNKNLYISSTPTLAARLDNIPFTPDWIIYDEFHHACAKTSLDVFDKLKELNPNLRITGLTATPRRLDGKGLHKVADSMVFGPTTAWLIEHGFLSKYEAYAPSQKLDFSKIKTLAGDYKTSEMEDYLEGTHIYGDAVEHYKKHCNGGQAICFCVSIKHSKKVRDMFLAHGIKAAHLDGSVKKSERDEINDKFAKGEIQIITNCNLISEGYDVPNCNAIFMLRPTKSLAMYLQQVGRGLRISPDGKPCKIFDHVGNIEEHDLPDAVRSWDLKDGKKKKKQDKIKKKKNITCDNCGGIWPAKYTVTRCPYCGSTKSDGRNILLVTTELMKIEKEESEYEEKSAAPRKHRKEAVAALKKNCETLADYMDLAKKLGYKPGWAKRQYDFKVKYKRKWK